MGGPLTTVRLDAELRARISRNLDGFERRSLELDGRRPAAVALTVLPDGRGRPCFAITRRSAHLDAHAGQWAIPGGRLDAGEDTASAARRELREEVGLRLDAGAVVGLLDDYPTRSGYVITPVVLWAGEGGELTPDPREVARAYRVPLAELDADGVPLLWSIPESDRPVLSIPFETLDTVIHSPTAAILYQFREVALHGRAMRVEHFEQPIFAWR
ncbi:MAG: CoA pyrophosphatase [Proteobacteria bacterium]|nr:CoA pyrophosphatase [Pseudomonadota bacterium]